MHRIPLGSPDDGIRKIPFPGGGAGVFAAKALLAALLATASVFWGAPACLAYTTDVASGQTITGQTVDGGLGVQTVEHGGTATATTINNTGVQNVSGTATNTTVYTGGVQNVQSGGTAYNSAINGIQNVQSNSTATYTSIGTSGIQNVMSGGTDNYASIYGTQNVYGTAANATIQSGGIQDVFGTATNSTIYSGGTQIVESGGVAGSVGDSSKGTTISGGAQVVRSGGAAYYTSINSGGEQLVESGGTASNTTINSGCTMSLSGTASNITIGYYGFMQINYGGAITGLTNNTQNNPGILIFNTTGGNGAYSFNITDSGGTGQTWIQGTGGVTLTGNITQANGVTVQGGSLTMHDNTLAAPSSAALAFQAGTNLASATLTNVTLQNGPNSPVFYVGNSSNTGNALTLNNMTVNPSSGTPLLAAQNSSSINFTANNTTLTSEIWCDNTCLGSVTLASGSTLTGAVLGSTTNMNIDSSSRWTMTADSSVGNLNVAGNLVFQNGGAPLAPKTLTVTGITGGQGLSGGTITMNTQLGDSSSLTDMIVVNGGTVTGTTKICINNVGGLGASTAGTNGILLVSAINGANTAASLTNPGFYMTNGPLQVGAYSYSLRPGDLSGSGQNWYLTSDSVSAPVLTSSSSSSGGSSSAPTGTYTGGPIVFGGSNPNAATVSGMTITPSSWSGQSGALVSASGNTGGANTVSFNNVTAATGGGTLISGTGGGNVSFSASGSTLAGDILFDSSSHGSVSLAGGTRLTGMIDPVDMSIDASSKWVMTASSVLGDLTLAGNVISQAPAGAFTPKTLTVNNLYGQGGTITLNTMLGSDNSQSDLLIVNGGKVTGATNLAINNVGGLGAPTFGNGIMLVQAQNGADTTAQSTKTGFALAAPVYAGSYAYFLRPGDVLGQGQNWYLSSMAGGPGLEARTAYNPDDALLASVIGMGHELMGATLATRDARQGDNVELATSGSGVTAWSRALGGHVRREGGGTVSPGFDGTLDGGQVGVEMSKMNGMGGQTSFGVYGAMAYGNATGWGDALGAKNSTVGQLDMTAYSAGVYGTHEWGSGGYVSAAAQASLLNGHAYGTYAAPVNGYGFAGSLEAGYPFRLGASHFYLEPRAQGIYQMACLDGVSLVNTHAGLNGGSRTTLRGGARLKYDATTASGVRWIPSLTVNLRHDEDANGKVTMSAPGGVTGLDTDFTGTTMELVGALTVKVTSRFALYGQAGYFTAVDGKSSRGVQGSVGLKVSF